MYDSNDVCHPEAAETLRDLTFALWITQTAIRVTLALWARSLAPALAGWLGMTTLMIITRAERMAPARRANQLKKVAKSLCASGM